jgi:hypothetical protein
VALIRKKKNNLYECLDSPNLELKILVSDDHKVSYTPQPVVLKEQSLAKSIPLGKKTHKSFSIKDALEGKAQPKAEALPVQEDSKEDDLTDQTSDIDDSSLELVQFNQIDLERQWQLFIQSHLVEKPRFASLLSTYQPQLTNDFLIKLSLESQLQVDMFNEVRIDLIHFLKRKLGSTDLTIEVAILSQDTSNGKIYTVEDKFKYLSQLNPNVIKLKQQLNLDFE